MGGPGRSPVLPCLAVGRPALETGRGKIPWRDGTIAPSGHRCTTGVDELGRRERVLGAFESLPATASATNIGRSASPPVPLLLLGIPARWETRWRLKRPLLLVVQRSLQKCRLSAVLLLLAHRTAAVGNRLVAAGLRVKELPVCTWCAIPPSSPAEIVCRNLFWWRRCVCGVHGGVPWWVSRRHLRLSVCRDWGDFVDLGKGCPWRLGWRRRSWGLRNKRRLFRCAFQHKALPRCKNAGPDGW